MDRLKEAITTEMDVCEMSISKWESRKTAFHDVLLMLEQVNVEDDYKEGE